MGTEQNKMNMEVLFFFSSHVAIVMSSLEVLSNQLCVHGRMEELTKKGKWKKMSTGGRDRVKGSAYH